MLNNADVYSVNATDLEGAHAQVKKLAKMDRLPKYERLEGLILIRQVTYIYGRHRYMSTIYFCVFVCGCLNVFIR